MRLQPTAVQVRLVQQYHIASLELAWQLAWYGLHDGRVALQPLEQAQHVTVTVNGIVIQAQQLQTGKPLECVGRHSMDLVVVQVSAE